MDVPLHGYSPSASPPAVSHDTARLAPRGSTNRPSGSS